MSDDRALCARVLLATAHRTEALFCTFVVLYALLLTAFEVVFRCGPASSRGRAVWPWSAFLTLFAGYFAWLTWSGSENPYLLKGVLVCAIALPALVAASVRDVSSVLARRRNR